MCIGVGLMMVGSGNTVTMVKTSQRLILKAIFKQFPDFELTDFELTDFAGSGVVHLSGGIHALVGKGSLFI